ncbi:MAG: S-adenosyl-L-methionine-dependent methyltransferase [Benniella sp.]|nr:MAG: S-adenosyl-L-methionine-dependent methyltransferase [Benniella sp.]
MSGAGNRSPPYWPESPQQRVPQQRGLSFSSGLHQSSAARDDVIKGTDDDAIISKLSAVDLGYLDDPFVKYFVKRPSRRPPLINRGSYLRTVSLDAMTEQFIKSTIEGPLTDMNASTTNTSTVATSTATVPSTSSPTAPVINRQIVSLGCGSDTRYFKFKTKGLSVYKYFEIDFQESTAKKAAVIKKNKSFTDIIGDPDLKLGQGGTELYSKDYCLLSGDLREFEHSIVPKLKAQGFDTGLPTLFLSECVLIYLQPKDSDAIVEWVGNNMDASLFVVYEQINPTDPFGAMMLRNLKARQIELPGIHAYPSLKSQEERFLARGWLAAKAVNMNTLHSSLQDDEMKRISSLEIFDEIEEWQLLADHYCVAWAYHAKALSRPDMEHRREQLIALLFNSVRFTDRK